MSHFGKKTRDQYFEEKIKMNSSNFEPSLHPSRKGNLSIISQHKVFRPITNRTLAGTFHRHHLMIFILISPIYWRALIFAIQFSVLEVAFKNKRRFTFIFFCYFSSAVKKFRFDFLDSNQEILNDTMRITGKISNPVRPDAVRGVLCLF